MINSYENMDLIKIRDEALDLRAEYMSALFAGLLVWFISRFTFATVNHAYLHTFLQISLPVFFLAPKLILGRFSFVLNPCKRT